MPFRIAGWLASWRPLSAWSIRDPADVPLPDTGRSCRRRTHRRPRRLQPLRAAPDARRVAGEVGELVARRPGAPHRRRHAAHLPHRRRHQPRPARGRPAAARVRCRQARGRRRGAAGEAGRAARNARRRRPRAQPGGSRHRRRSRAGGTRRCHGRRAHRDLGEHHRSCFGISAFRLDGRHPDLSSPWARVRGLPPLRARGRSGARPLRRRTRREHAPG